MLIVVRRDCEIVSAYAAHMAVVKRGTDRGGGGDYAGDHHADEHGGNSSRAPTGKPLRGFWRGRNPPW